MRLKNGMTQKVLTATLLFGRVPFMQAKPLPPLDFLRECFCLSETTPSGLLWRTRPSHHFPPSYEKNWNARFAGTPAGSLRYHERDRRSYFFVGITLGGKVRPFGTHRIIYALAHNEQLSHNLLIDHIDNDGTNNCVRNLRSVTPSQNSHNQTLRPDNTSGVKCVVQNSHGSWYGIVTCNWVKYYTGASPSKEIITEMTRELREKLHKEFHNHGEKCNS